MAVAPLPFPVPPERQDWVLSITPPCRLVSIRCIRNTQAWIRKYLQEGAVPGRGGIYPLKVLSQRGAVTRDFHVDLGNTCARRWEDLQSALTRLSGNHESDKQVQTNQPCRRDFLPPYHESTRHISCGRGWGKGKANALSDLGERQEGFRREVVLAFLWRNLTDLWVWGHWCRKLHMNIENRGTLDVWICFCSTCSQLHP